MPKIRFLMITLCFLGLGISYVDRINLAIAAPFIHKELGLSDGSMGLVLGAFFWTYAFMQIPAGWFIDRVGARIGFSLAVGWWSAWTILTGAMRSLPSLFITRLMLGMGEAGAAPGCVKVVYSWFPRTERGLAAGIFDAGPRAGTAVALPITAAAIGIWGWRAAFYVTGMLGVLWLVAWWAIYQEPEESRFITPEQRERLLAARAAPQVAKGQVEWGRLLRHRTTWAMICGFFCFNFVNYFFITWFPAYLVQAKGFTLAQLGTLGAVPALMSIPGSILGGWTSDSLFRRGMSLTAARKTCLVGGLLVASSILFAAFTDTIYVTLALFSLAYASLAFTAANIWTLPADVAPSQHYVATLGGICNFASNLAGVATTALTGLLLMVSGGSFVAPLMVAGGTCVLGALVYCLFLGRVEPLWVVGNVVPDRDSEFAVSAAGAHGTGND